MCFTAHFDFYIHLISHLPVLPFAVALWHTECSSHLHFNGKCFRPSGRFGIRIQLQQFLSAILCQKGFDMGHARYQQTSRYKVQIFLRLLWTFEDVFIFLLLTYLWGFSCSYVRILIFLTYMEMFLSPSRRKKVHPVQCKTKHIYVATRKIYSHSMRGKIYNIQIYNARYHAIPYSAMQSIL